MPAAEQKKKKRRGSKSMPPGCPKSIEPLKYGFAPARRVCKRRPTIWLTRRINDKCNHCRRQLQKGTQQRGRKERGGGRTSQKVGKHERMIKTPARDPAKSADRGSGTTCLGQSPLHACALPRPPRPVRSIAIRSPRTRISALWSRANSNVLWLAEHNLLACCDSGCWSGSTSCCVSVGCASLSTSSSLRVIPCCSFTTTFLFFLYFLAAAQKLFAGFDCV